MLTDSGLSFQNTFGPRPLPECSLDGTCIRLHGYNRQRQFHAASVDALVVGAWFSVICSAFVGALNFGRNREMVNFDHGGC